MTGLPRTPIRPPLWRVGPPRPGPANWPACGRPPARLPVERAATDSTGPIESQRLRAGEAGPYGSGSYSGCSAMAACLPPGRWVLMVSRHLRWAAGS